MSQIPVVLGLDFGGTKIAIAVSDLTGVRLASVVVSSLADQGAKAAFHRGVGAARDLLAGLGSRYRLAAVGAATFGIPFDDHVELAPSIPGWEDLPFGAALREAFPGIPVRTATDVKAAAEAEVRWGALHGCDPGIYLNLGTGLAAAIVSHGEVISGAHRASGEIGYNLRRPDDVGLVGSNRMPLEDAISGRALAGVFPNRMGRPATAAELFALASTQADAAAVVDGFVRELAMHVANLATAVDPIRLAVGGGMVRSWDRVEPGLRSALDAAVPYPPELVPGAFPYDAPLRGALSLGVAAAGEYRTLGPGDPAGDGHAMKGLR